MVQNIPGILIVPKKTNSAEKLTFELWITQNSSSNPFFFSNPSIREAISNFPKHGPMQSTRLGDLEYSLNSDKYFESLFGKLSEKELVEKKEKWMAQHRYKDKPVYVYEYFPYLSKDERIHFEKRGVALFAEKIALRELLKVSPNAAISPYLWMTDFRMTQLEGRGVKIKSSKQIFSAREVLQTINKHIREYRIKKRPNLSSQRLAVAMKSGRKLRKRK